MRILLVMLEFPLWLQARHWSYVANFAVREGMAANGIETVVLPAFYGLRSDDPRSWLAHARELLDGQRFDQVWIWLVHNDFDEACLDYLASLAPVRVGWLGENLFYLPHEQALSPELPARREAFFRQKRILTHVVVAADEVEAVYLERECGLPAIWWPTAVPRAYVFAKTPPPMIRQAVFCGSPYGTRKAFLQHEAVERVLMTISPPENAYSLPDAFNALCASAQAELAGTAPPDTTRLTAFVDGLHALRKEIFSVWLKAIRRYALFVNLPSYGKCYTSRVVEAMAAGRPTLAWRVPDRPRNTGLFTEEADIFLFDGDDVPGFAAKIEALVNDPDRLEPVALAARDKLLAYHTTEIRIRQVMDWIESGLLPVYSDAERDARDADRDGGEEQAFYVELFTRNPEWSAANPNKDEQARGDAVEALLRQALPSLGRRPAILEVGAGRGWLGQRLGTYGDYLGLEPVEAVVARAKSLYPDRAFMTGSLDDLPREGIYDVVVASEVLEHVPLHAQAAFVAGLVGRVRPGGVCIVTTPRAELYQSWRHIVAPQPTECWLDEDGLRRLFEINGCEPVTRRLVYKTMPRLYAYDTAKTDFMAPDQVPLYQAWLFHKPGPAGEVAA